MVNFREKYVKEYLETMEKNYEKLNVWEREFYNSMKNLSAEKFSTHQYNKLKEIVEELRKVKNGKNQHTVV